MGKESSYNTRVTRDTGSIPGLGRSPGGGHGNPLLYSCLENPMDRGALVGYSPWDCKELDVTERQKNNNKENKREAISENDAGKKSTELDCSGRRERW